MTVVYITEDGAVLRKRGERFVVDKDGAELVEIEMSRVSSILMLDSAQVTTQAMTEMLEHGVEFAILSHRGKLLGQLTPPLAKNIFLRRAQFEKEKSPEFALIQAKEVVSAKVHNQRQVLIRHMLDEQGEQPEVNSAAKKIEETALKIQDCADLASLRGMEGACAAAYWQSFGALFKAPGIAFTKREKHPSPDPVNAVLSFGYVLLTSTLHSLLDGMGFDPFLGFYHEESYGRPSLALDMVEPFRAPVVDRFCVRTFNLGILKPEDFQPDGEGGVRLTRPALKAFFRAWEKYLIKLEIRRALREQCEQLVRVFEGKEEKIIPWQWEAR